MSAVEIVGLASWVCGVLTGAAATAALSWRWRKPVVAKECPGPAAHVSDDDEEFAVTAQFANHAAAMHQQLSDYADHLADGDRALRERLQRFEGRIS